MAWKIEKQKDHYELTNGNIRLGLTKTSKKSYKKLVKIKKFLNLSNVELFDVGVGQLKIYSTMLESVNDDLTREVSRLQPPLIMSPERLEHQKQFLMWIIDNKWLSKDSKFVNQATGEKKTIRELRVDFDKSF
jgi:hypothetical protein